MSNEGIELVNYLRHYGLSNEIFVRLHPAGVSIHEYLQSCMATEYFMPESDDEVARLRLIFLRVTIRTDKCALPMDESDLESLLQAAIKGFPSSHDGHVAVDTGGYLGCNHSIH